MPRRILLDTGVVIRYVQSHDTLHDLVKSCLSRMSTQGDELVLTPQTIRELWAVLTRPKEVNGYGRSVTEAKGIVQILLNSFTFLDDEPGIFSVWLDLVSKHEVQGVKVHDANHAAAAQHHKLTYVLTLNPSDFGRYESSGLLLLTPQDA